MHTVKFKIQKAKMYYDRKAKDLSELEIGQPVRVNPKTQKRKGNMEPVWKTSSKDHKLMSTSGIDVTAETFAQQMKLMIHFPSKSAMLQCTCDSFPVDSPAVSPPTPKVKKNRVSTSPKVPTPLKSWSCDRKPVSGNQIKFRASSRVVKLPRKL